MYGILNLLYQSEDIAMEAEDITAATARDTRTLLGNNTATQENEADDGGEDNIEKTDDIFGTEEAKRAKENAESGNVENPNDEQDTADSNVDDTPEDNNTNNEDATDTDLDTNDEMIDDSDESPAPPFANKSKIRDHMVHLYNLLGSNIETLTKSMSSIEDYETVRTINAILSNMRNAKDYLYKTLTEDLKTTEYSELLRKYITLKRVYEISIKMLEVHFSEVYVPPKGSKSKQSTNLSKQQTT